MSVSPGLPVPEMQVLRPPAQLAAKNAPSKPFVQPPAQGVAATGK